MAILSFKCLYCGFFCKEILEDEELPHDTLSTGMCGRCFETYQKQGIQALEKMRGSVESRGLKGLTDRKLPI